MPANTILELKLHCDNVDSLSQLVEVVKFLYHLTVVVVLLRERRVPYPRKCDQNIVKTQLPSNNRPKVQPYDIKIYSTVFLCAVSPHQNSDRGKRKEHIAADPHSKAVQCSERKVIARYHDENKKGVTM
tara:strand:+ start:463 stop:849 length:387 start_codon:yes stop_codon:yes gene_type:complete